MDGYRMYDGEKSSLQLWLTHGDSLENPNIKPNFTNDVHPLHYFCYHASIYLSVYNE